MMGNRSKAPSFCMENSGKSSTRIGHAGTFRFSPGLEGNHDLLSFFCRMICKV